MFGVGSDEAGGFQLIPFVVGEQARAGDEGLAAARFEGEGATLAGHHVDDQLGEIGGVPFYMGAAQYEYWKHTQLIIDVVPGRGGMFSLENGEGVRFLVRSRLFTDEEFAALSAARRV